MRVFVALMPDTKSIELLKPLLQSTEGWNHPLDLHMTLRFLGSRSRDQVNQLIDELNSCDFKVAVDWVTDSLGSFPNKQNAKVWALDGELIAELEGLQVKLDGKLSLMEGLSAYQFKPHVSLCVKNNAVWGDNMSLGDGESKKVKLSFDRIALLQSVGETPSIGPRYLILWQRSLSR